jgi:hypothetical protein
MVDTAFGLLLAFLGSGVLMLSPHRRFWDVFGGVLVVAGLIWIVVAGVAAGELLG